MTPLADPLTGEIINDEPLPDPYDRAASTGNEFNRPLRVEDTVPRHGGNGTPKVWWPDNSRASFYGRPSGWGKRGENTRNLDAWKIRTALEAFLDMGDQSKALRAERGALRSDDKSGMNQLIERGIRMANVSDRLGTAVHAMTERHDLGESFRVPDEYSADLEAWKQITRHFEIVAMASGRPGVEVFVAMDYQMIDAHGEPLINPDTGEPFRMVRLAGTYDRMVRYRPCPICGCRNYILDLKTGSVRYGRQTIAVQLGIYGNAKEYIHYAEGADRFDLPDVCRHRGIVINLPAGTGEATAKWVDIAWGYEKAVDLMPKLMSYQDKKDLMLDFVPAPDVWAEIDKATTPEQVRALFATYPGPQWEANSFALAKYAAARLETLGGQAHPKWKR